MSGIASKKHRMGDEKSADPMEQKRKRSDLRSTKADLKVIVGNYIDGSKKEYWYYSQILASQSGYIDTLLSTALPTINDLNPSKDHRKIVFSGITPSQWERMMEYLNNPLVALYSMTVEDAMELAVLYDQYEFKAGIELCDDVLVKKALPQWDDDGGFKRNDYNESRVDLYVEAIRLSEACNLRMTFHFGRSWLLEMFQNLERYGPVCERFPLTASQIKLLVPTIVRDSQLRRLPDILGDDSYKYIEIPFMKQYFHGCGIDLGHELESFIRIDTLDVSNPLFPRFFVNLCRKSYYWNLVKMDSIISIKVEVPDRDDGGVNPAVGEYQVVRDTDPNHFEKTTGFWYIKFSSKPKQWQIYHDKRIVYVRPNSRFAHVPPKTGWVNTEDKNLPIPTLEYVRFPQKPVKRFNLRLSYDSDLDLEWDDVHDCGIPQS